MNPKRKTRKPAKRASAKKNETLLSFTAVFSNTYFVILMFLAIIALTGILTVMMHNEIEKGYHMKKRLEQDAVRVQQNIAELEIQIAVLSRPDRIRRIATERFKMVVKVPNTEVIRVQ